MDCSARPSANREKGGQTPASDLYCTQLLVTCKRSVDVIRWHPLMRLLYLGTLFKWASSKKLFFLVGSRGSSAP